MATKKRLSTNKSQGILILLGAIIISFLIGKNYETLDKKFNPKYKELRAVEKSNKELLQTGNFQTLKESDNWISLNAACNDIPLSTYTNEFFTFSYPSDFTTEGKFDHGEQAGITLAKQTVWENPDQFSTTKQEIRVSATKTSSSLLDEVKSNLHDTNLDISQYIRKTSLDGMENAVIINNPGMYTSHTTVALEDGVLYRIYDFGSDKTGCGVSIIYKTFKRI